MTASTKNDMKNFHLPLPAEIYEALKQEAVSARKPVTSMARDVIEAWLRERRRTAVREALASYAMKHAGTETDLDPLLEAASIDLLRDRKRRGRRP